ncbi:hypothetical protein, partial [Ectopseudomonas composti]|uniref:hypothetical protein n=1 Tax=Ectopseudomonas composti TaxID=658457 RepID=UPI0019D6C014
SPCESRSSSSSYTKPQIANAVWGFFFAARKIEQHAPHQDANRPVRAAHSTGWRRYIGINKKAT